MITYYREGFLPKDGVQRVAVRNPTLRKRLSQFPVGETFVLSRITRGESVEGDIFWLQTARGKVGLCRELMAGFRVRV